MWNNSLVWFRQVLLRCCIVLRQITSVAWGFWHLDVKDEDMTAIVTGTHRTNTVTYIFLSGNIVCFSKLSFTGICSCVFTSLVPTLLPSVVKWTFSVKKQQQQHLCKVEDAVIFKMFSPTCFLCWTGFIVQLQTTNHQGAHAYPNPNPYIFLLGDNNLHKGTKTYLHTATSFLLLLFYMDMTAYWPQTLSSGEDSLTPRVRKTIFGQNIVMVSKNI